MLKLRHLASMHKSVIVKGHLADQRSGLLFSQESHESVLLCLVSQAAIHDSSVVSLQLSWKNHLAVCVYVSIMQATTSHICHCPVIFDH